MEDGSDLVAKMREQRSGHLEPALEYLGRIDPEFLSAYNELALLNFRYGETQGRVLSAKVKELIAVALLAAVRGETTKQHIRKALEHGASRREVVEALEMAMHISGAPSLQYGLARLMEVENAK